MFGRIPRVCSPQRRHRRVELQSSAQQLHVELLLLLMLLLLPLPMKLPMTLKVPSLQCILLKRQSKMQMHRDGCPGTVCF